VIRWLARRRPTPAEFEARAAESVRKTLLQLTRSRRPILVGPWTSEVGFELLYWIPFLRWAVRRFELDPTRLMAFSRGGVASWYRGICDGYVELFELQTVAAHRSAVHARAAAAGGQKQGTIGRLDRELVRTAVERGRVPARHDLLHPSAMYELFRLSWKGGTSLRHVLAHMEYEPLDPPAQAAAPPEEPYTAVKFYFRESFPDTSENREFVRRALRALACDGPAVMLSTGHQVDEHTDVDPGQEAFVRRPLVGVDASRNLEAQSAMIAGAARFVGTYGGLSYLALLYGVPGVSIISHPQHILPFHHIVASRAAERLGTPLTMVDSGHVPMVATIYRPTVGIAT
jgi:hypothetical protein